MEVEKAATADRKLSISMARSRPTSPTNNPLTPICTISFCLTNRIRLDGNPFPQKLVAPLRHVINSTWSRGMSKEKDFHGTKDFKVTGAPWIGSGKESVEARKLVSGLLKEMAKQGWRLLQSCDLSKESDDKDTLFFEPAEPDPDAEMFAVSFNREDKIRLIGATPPEVIQSFTEAIYPKSCGYAPEDVKLQYYHGAVELTLCGMPWISAEDKEIIVAKSILCRLIQILGRTGYKLYASVDVSGKMGDMESWIFRKVTNEWT